MKPVTHLEGYLNYATALFDQATIERYLEYWQQLLQGMVTDSTQAIHRLPMMQAAERAQVLHGFNQRQVDFLTDDCIHERFEQQVVARPDAVAVVCDDESLTYDALNRQANQLAHWLIEQGVRPDSRVAIALPRSCTLMVAILATLKAGGAYVPLDPNTPQERLAYILQDSTPEVLITTQAVLSQFGPLPPQTSVVMPDRTDNHSEHHGTQHDRTNNLNTGHLWADQPAENLDRHAAGFNQRDLNTLTNHHLAYIIYTSGSTGKPKGVMVEHANVLRLMAATQVDYQFNADDVWTLFHFVRI
ncbi:AMP-binding protein [Vibrio sp. PP-XX7]